MDSDNPHGISAEHFIPGESNKMHHTSTSIESPSIVRTDDWLLVDCRACLIGMGEIPQKKAPDEPQQDE